MTYNMRKKLILGLMGWVFFFEGVQISVEYPLNTEVNPADIFDSCGLGWPSVKRREWIDLGLFDSPPVILQKWLVHNQLKIKNVEIKESFLPTFIRAMFGPNLLKYCSWQKSFATFTAVAKLPLWGELKSNCHIFFNVFFFSLHHLLVKLTSRQARFVQQNLWSENFTS